MARGIVRGDIWMFEFRKPDKKRPVLVLARQDAIDVLHAVMVVPITTVIRGLPSEVALGTQHGLKRASVANLDQVQLVEKARLHRYIGHAGSDVMSNVCSALAIAAGCT